MEFKVVLSDPKTGKTYQRELKDEKAKKLNNLIVGNEFDGSILGLQGYKLLITGGSDKSGFPMKKGVHGIASPKILMSGGIGYNPKTRVRKRKRVRGEKIANNIVQVNTKISKYGKGDIEVLLGLKEEEKPEVGVEEKPKEEVKEKPKEEAKEKPEGEVKEKPKEEAKEKPEEEAKEKPEEEAKEKPKEEVEKKLKEEVEKKVKEEVETKTKEKK